MATTVRGSSTYASAASETTLVVPVPAGVVDGDRMYMAVFLTATSGTITVPAGWNDMSGNWPSFFGLLAPASSTSSHARLMWRIASSEPSSYSVTVTSGRGSASIVAVFGHNTTTPEADAASSVDTTAALSVPSPDITATGAGLLLTWHGGRILGNGAVATWAPDASETEVAEVASAVAAISNSSHEIAQKTISSSGAVGAKTAVASGSGVTSVNWASMAVIVNDAAGGGGGAGVPVVLLGGL